MTDLERARHLMTDVVVAELDRWLENEQEWMRVDSKWQHLIAKEVVERARDELVGLRTVLDIQKRLPDKIAAAVRDEALEEAAQVCERADRSTHPATCADMIRALKEQ